MQTPGESRDNSQQAQWVYQSRNNYRRGAGLPVAAENIPNLRSLLPRRLHGHTVRSHAQARGPLVVALVEAQLGELRVREANVPSPAPRCTGRALGRTLRR